MERLIATMLVILFLFLLFEFFHSPGSHNTLERTISTRERVLAGIRSIAGMPTALRNSMRATDGKRKLVNPQLLSCAGGNSVISGLCLSGKKTAFTLYSPMTVIDSADQPIEIRPIASPEGTQDSAAFRFDTFGSPCSTQSPDCPLLVFTSFTAQCAPPPMVHPAPGTITQKDLNAAARCRVADVIEVTYSVKLDPAFEADHPDLKTVFTTNSGSVVTPVRLISGLAPHP